MNEESLVSVSHYLALNTSLPFVHTARRYYRLNGLLRTLEERTMAMGNCRYWSVPKMFKICHLEEVKVVTRYPYVNLRMDHYLSLAIALA
jgi:hypothetical protein